MARLATSGFEGGEATLDGVGTSGGAAGSYVTSGQRSGARAIQYGITAGTKQFLFTSALSTFYYGRVYVAISARPDTDLRIAQLRLSTNGNTGISVWLKVSDDTLFLRDDNAAVQIGSASSPITYGTYYRIEVGGKLESGASDDYGEFRLDGASIASSTTLSLATAGGNAAWIVGNINGSTGTTYTVTDDDVALNDSTGAAQNTWPGDGKVVLLLPTSTSGTGTGWTDDNASSTGAALLAAVDNTPPIGIADTTAGGGGHQDRNATSNANTDLSMAMTTYTAAGIATGDTINVLDPITMTAAPVATSAKAGTVGVTSNPAITNINLSAGGTAGAFWSGVAAGTYPTGWKLSHGTTTYAPSVTLGTAPVMRVTQVTSSTRVAMVCFMGIYVDYTPAVAALPPPRRSLQAILAQ